MLFEKNPKAAVKCYVYNTNIYIESINSGFWRIYYFIFFFRFIFVCLVLNNIKKFINKLKKNTHILKFYYFYFGQECEYGIIVFFLFLLNVSGFCFEFYLLLGILLLKMIWDLINLFVYKPLF